jgi:hypothetical protein
MALFLGGIAKPPAHKIFDCIEDAVERMLRMNPALDPAWAMSLAARVLDRVDEGLRWSWDPLHRTRSPATFPAKRFYGVLARIQAPTTLVNGTRSWYRFDDLKPRESALGPVATHRLDSSHALSIEVPHELSDIVLGTLQ